MLSMHAVNTIVQDGDNKKKSALKIRLANKIYHNTHWTSEGLQFQLCHTQANYQIIAEETPDYKREMFSSS